MEQQHQRLNWDDLRFFLALARTRTLRGASRTLRVSPSTIARRLASLEADLGTRLAIRVDGEYELTTAGDRLVEMSEGMDSLVAAVDRDIVGRDALLEGHIKLTLPPELAANLLVDDIAGFCAAHPDITVELAQTNAIADLSRREADIAIRAFMSGNQPPDYLIGRRVGNGHYANYVAAGLTDSEAKLLNWVGWSHEGDFPKWVRESEFPDRAARHVLSDVASQQAACRSGMGIVMIPCFVGDRDPALRRYGRRPPKPGFDIWVLSHGDLRETARFAAMRLHLADSVLAKEHQLTGR